MVPIVHLDPVSIIKISEKEPTVIRRANNLYPLLIQVTQAMSVTVELIHIILSINIDSKKEAKALANPLIGMFAITIVLRITSPNSKLEKSLNQKKLQFQNYQKNQLNRKMLRI